MARTRKLGLIIITLGMLIITSYAAIAIAALPQDSGSMSMTCQFPTKLQLSMLQGEKVYGSCRVSTNVSCVSRVYHLLNATHYEELLQTNPQANYRLGQNGVFESVNGIVSVYWQPGNLLLETTPEFSVECSDANGSYAVEYATVNITTDQSIKNTPGFLIGLKSEAGYYVGAIIGFLIIGSLFILTGRFFKWW